LICPDYTNSHWNFQKNGPEVIGPDGPPSYDELDFLYIFGDKTDRRYTLKDGLLNIRRAFECNIRENVLDGYLTKLGGWEPFPSGDGFDKLSPEERKARAIRLHETVMYIYNICAFNGAFCGDGKPHSHYLHKELFNPAFIELWNSLINEHDTVLDAGHYINGFRNRDWLNIDPAEIPGICTGMCEVIEKVKDADMKMLEKMNRAIEIIDKKGE